MRPDIGPGGIFPDYALPDHTGTARTLSELQGRDPLISPWPAATTALKSTSSTSSWRPFPTFSGIYVDALKALRSQIPAANQPVPAGSP
jgi:hypothetical protein